LTRVVRGHALVPKPWRNGRGVTRDVLDANGGADWQIGLADLDDAAPFSSFPGMDRTFTLVAGGPVRFRFEDGAEVVCPPLVPVLFPGDRPLACRPEAGPARALNVIVDRARYSAAVAVMRLADGHAARLGPGTTALHCAAGRVKVGEILLETGDTLAGGSGSARAEDGSATVVLVAVVAA
jgi:uncharacterized protein